MKSITIPDSVKYETLRAENGETKDLVMSLQDFLREALDQNVELGKGFKNIERSDRLHKAINSVNGNANIHLEEADYDLVKTSVENAQWKPRYGRLFLPFYQAVNNAQQSILENAKPVETPK